jgi:phage tail sheath protein FI
MSATTDFVGVRNFSDLRSTVAKIDTRDSTVIGMAVPAPAADEDIFPLNTKVSLPIDDTEKIAALGAGLARDYVNQFLQEGIVTDVAFVRTQHSVLEDPEDKLEAEINGIVGSAGAKTGAWALLDDSVGLEPGCVISPGYTSQRIGDAANAVTATLSTIAGRIIDCIVLADTPVASREAALEWAEDFATSLNVVGLYPQIVTNLGAGNVTRPMSASMAAAMVRRDKEASNPYKAFWNRPLQGALKPSVPVGYTDGDTASDANWLNQRGIGTLIERNLIWAPFTTATDPAVKNWRSIKRIRTRRAIEKATLRPMRKYLSEDIHPDAVNLIYRSLDQFCMDLVTAKALIDYELVWSKAMNPASLLEAGALRVKARFAETPDLVDLQIYTEPQPEAFDVLEASIAASLQQLGLQNIRVTA